MQPFDPSQKYPPPPRPQLPALSTGAADEEIVLAEIATPQNVAPQFPAQPFAGVKVNSPPAWQVPMPYDWRAMAVFSWIIPLIIGLLSGLAVLMHLSIVEYPTWWMPVGFLWVVGIICIVVPVYSRGARDRRSSSRTHATAGIFLSLLALGWMGLCEMVILGISRAKTPEGQRAIAVRRADLRRQAEQQARQRQAEIQEERRRTEPARREQARQAAIKTARVEAAIYAPIRDEFLAIRLQQGEGAGTNPTPPGTVQGEPLPLFSPRPAKTTSFQAPARVGEKSLFTPWSFADGVKIQPLDIPGDELVPQAIWPEQASGSSLLLLTKSGHLLEVSTKDWRVLRDSNLQGPCVGMAMSKEGLLVARSEPGGILVIRPERREQVTVFPIANLAQIAANPKSPLAFVRTTQRSSEFAVLNLNSKQILYVLNPEEWTRVGREPDAKNHPVSPYNAIKHLHVSADGWHLVALADQLFHWSIEGDKLRYIESSGDRTGSGGSSWLAEQSSEIRFYGQGEFGNDFRLPRASGVRTYGVSHSPDGGLDVVFRSDRPYLVPGYGSNPRSQAFSPPAPGPQQLQTTSSLPFKGSFSAGDVLAEQLPATQGIQVQRLKRRKSVWCWSADGEKLFQFIHQAPRMIDPTTLKEERAVNLPLRGECCQMRITGAGLVVVEAKPTRLWVLDPVSLDAQRVIDAPDVLRGKETRGELLATSPGSPYLIAVSGQGGVEMIDLRDGRLISETYAGQLCGRERNPDSADELEKLAAISLTRDGKYLLATIDGVHRLAVSDQGLKYEQGTERMFKPLPSLLSGDSARILAICSQEDSLKLRGKCFLYDIGNLKTPARVLRGSLPLGPSATLDESAGHLWGESSQLVDMATQQAQQLELPPDTGRGILLAPHGKRALLAGDSEVLLLDLSKLDYGPAPATAFPPLVEKLTVTAGTDYEITEAEQSVVKEVKEEEGAKYHYLSLDSPGQEDDGAAFSPDGKWLFVKMGGEEPGVAQISLPDLTLRRKLIFKKPGSCKLMHAAGGLGVWTSDGNRLWLLGYADLKVRRVVRLLDRLPFATAAAVPLMFVSGEQFFVIDLKTCQTQESCDINLLAKQNAAARKTDSWEFGRPGLLRVSGDGREIYVNRRLLRWDGQHISLDTDNPIRHAGHERLTWNLPHQEWRAVGAYRDPKSSDEAPFQAAFFTSQAPAVPRMMLDVPMNRVNNEKRMALGDADLFAHSSREKKLELIRFSDGKEERYPLDEKYYVEAIFPAATGRKALVWCSRQLLIWVEFPEAPAEGK